MWIINIANLRGLDLNLLVVFHVLMQEKHVTRAAARLHLSQGAVSAALGRLRSVFNDPLFQRTRAGMSPTPKALALAPKIAQALVMLDDFIYPSTEFDPATTTRNFHVAMSDDVETVLAPSILRAVRKQGWNVSFSLHQTNSQLWNETLDDPEIDLVICASPAQVSAHYRESVLFASSYSCLYSSKSSSFSHPPTLDEYIDAHHVRVSFNTRRGFVDEFFELQGRERRVEVSLSHFSGLVTALHVGDLIATIPSYAARALAENTDLTVSTPPIPVPRHTVSLLWKVQQETQLDHKWLRTFIESRFDVPGFSGAA
ncbi:LysR family transcriptional regulator [Corynebacterium pacaense]|uniref:LysR family transcriptional regulator n=1 Tax=Corynebacterium pacaense TaxID=1816684 RepID=UPI0015C497BF|nr:LysR family transcriptional regulator [Corynebacterium pacaense]